MNKLLLITLILASVYMCYAD